MADASDYLRRQPVPTGSASRLLIAIATSVIAIFVKRVELYASNIYQVPKHQEADLHRLRNGCGDLSRVTDRAESNRLPGMQAAALVDEGRRTVRSG